MRINDKKVSSMIPEYIFLTDIQMTFWTNMDGVVITVLSP